MYIDNDGLFLAVMVVAGIVGAFLGTLLAFLVAA